MRTLKRADCALLHLVLKKKWYEMIESGEKKEEYREEKPYWDVRLRNWIDRLMRGRKTYLVVAFSLGYAKPSMFFCVHLYPIGDSCEELSYRVLNPHPEWGEPDTPHYVIVLSERVVLE